MIRVNAQIQLDPREIQEEFVRASGPGGQNVNKVSTAVQLRFDVTHSPSLPEPVRDRLITLAGRRLTQDGVLILSAERYRSQRRNRDDALERLIALIREACQAETPRRPTRPTLASRKRRLEGKQRRGETKKLRTLKPGSDT
ncbi:MAG: aminoacyl-tRNA hydrolase [Hydrogenophilales bacterium 16-64-46]|nr:MAG: aminoacyl-tRNA hydrolase [Hydrogenophilales bacterium 12-64-13]OYZ05461.1 MAG: aminoacyl-tRNA hydrolase [Hydrogenophilales bacterium 16-64-46]OZA40041.1 MAG: aminoacyl-tRNA hydrolase [Hydrogenophilales bacterium 17-64-34]HQT00906.1 alternative ribosome rescue aminoacyl-tRNA hydrolase ArfB [Thiobacillus sp.]